MKHSVHEQYKDAIDTGDLAVHAVYFKRKRSLILLEKDNGICIPLTTCCILVMSMTFTLIR